MKQLSEKLDLARTRIQNLIAEQEDIISELEKELGLKNTSAVVAREFLTSKARPDFISRVKDYLIFLISDTQA